MPSYELTFKLPKDTVVTGTHLIFLGPIRSLDSSRVVEMNLFPEDRLVH